MFVFFSKESSDNVFKVVCREGEKLHTQVVSFCLDKDVMRSLHDWEVGVKGHICLCEALGA